MRQMKRRPRWRAASASLVAAVSFAAAMGAAASIGLAQNNDKEMIAEIVRKALAPEGEAGFCATTGWRLETAATHDSNILIYETGIVGSTKTFINRAQGQADYCAYLRIAQVFAEGGRRCVRTQIWFCTVGQSCAFAKFKGCRAPDTWKWTAER